MRIVVPPVDLSCNGCRNIEFHLQTRKRPAPYRAFKPGFLGQTPNLVSYRLIRAIRRHPFSKHVVPHPPRLIGAIAREEAGATLRSQFFIAPPAPTARLVIHSSASSIRGDGFARKAMLSTRSIRALSCCAQNGG